MSTKQLVQTNSMARLITGLGLFEYPLNRTRLLISIFYASCIISLYLYFSVEYLKTFFMIDNVENPRKPRISAVLSYIQIACCLFVLVNTWYRTKMCYFWYKQVDEIKITMNSIGCRANGKSLMRFQYFLNIFIFLYVVMVTYLVLQRLHYFPLNVCAMSMYCIFYTFLVSLLANAEFSYSVRHLASLFGELNKKLSDMLPLRENQQVRVELDAGTERHHLKVFNTIRRLHLELVRSSLYINDLYALQNLVLTISSIVRLALLLYRIYSLKINNISQIYNKDTIKLLFCLANVLIVNFCCTRTTEEIRQFTLQLIDNRLLFKVYGFFNLGRRLFTMIVNGVITYLVIIMQIPYLQRAGTDDAGSTMSPSDVLE